MFIIEETICCKMSAQELADLIASIKQRIPLVIAMGEPKAKIETDPHKFSKDLFRAWVYDSKAVLKEMDWEFILPALDVLKIDREAFWPLCEYSLWEEHLPDEGDIRIYRGGKGPLEELCKGYSWSIQAGFAHNFALEAGTDSMMATGLINKEDILLLGDIEMEVIVRPKKIRDIQKYDY